MVDFSVYVKHKGDSGVVFDCSTNDQEITIQNVQYTDEISRMMKVSRWERSYNHYAGPDFASLDERL